MMSASETDVSELCRLGLGRVRDLVRPDTSRIGQAFDTMMSRVKVCGTIAVRELSIDRRLLLHASYHVARSTWYVIPGSRYIVPVLVYSILGYPILLTVSRF